MKKSNFLALVLGTVEGVCFAIGMCMALLPEWGMMRQGVVTGVIGMVILLADLLVWRRMEKKAPIRVSGKTIGAILVGVAGALMLGVGMCFCMVFARMILGVVIGVVGMLVLLMLIPLTKGLK
ncbi:MAG TPA: hypothetical protein H9761_05525 [Candidatus Eisenbergiella merdavium]|uniref:Uncharacterized protein n=1 Tax=Candidatus Eisenbergiella merdavium TaxID=2838551 RepID=A0A9D2NEC3_9FIRM|nr:hypothetical protein [Candidatus Eisenbergiella merdavium]